VKESTVEEYLIGRVGDLGGKTAKFTVPADNGHPDRLVKLPRVPAFLIELKRPGKTPTPLQMQRISEWQEAGVFACWADSKAGVELMLHAATQHRD
jgi:hypothetical protein